MTLPSGQYRDLVHVQRRTKTPDGYGNTEDAWVQKWASIPARVLPMRGGEEVKQARLAMVSNFEISLRANPTTKQITAGDRLVNARSKATYDILHIADLNGDGREFLLTCRTIK